MSERYARIAFAGCAAVLAAALGATTALAAATWTIKPGGAVRAKSGKATVNDTTTGTTTTCLSLATRGTLKSGSGLSGPDAGSISAVGFNRCTSPLAEIRPRHVGIIWTFTATDLPWHVTFSADNNGVVTGTISHLQITVQTTACTAVIDGTSGTASDGVLRFRYTDSTSRLKLLSTGGNLHYYNVSGCFGVIVNGDVATLGATFTLSPKQAITSP